jgi:hypothetical protein
VCWLDKISLVENNSYYYLKQKRRRIELRIHPMTIWQNDMTIKHKTDHAAVNVVSHGCDNGAEI